MSCSRALRIFCDGQVRDSVEGAGRSCCTLVDFDGSLWCLCRVWAGLEEEDAVAPFIAVMVSSETTGSMTGAALASTTRLVDSCAISSPVALQQLLQVSIPSGKLGIRHRHSSNWHSTLPLLHHDVTST